MALRAGPKASYVEPINLDGLPEDSGDRALAALRRWGINPYVWQERCLRDFARADRPRLAYVQIPRKNGKSALSAMQALVELILYPERHIYAVSDSERNLHSVLWLEICQMIERSPALRDSLHIFKNKLENPHNGSFLELRPGNFKATQGINPHLVLADEVHLIKPEVWHGYQMALAARDDPLLLGTTTPGYELDGVAYELYMAALDGTDPDLYHMVFEPLDPGCDLDDREAWEQANPRLQEPDCASFLAGLEYDYRHLPEHEFRRFRLGQWTTTKEAWLPLGAWNGLARKRQLVDGETVWLGFDGSYSGDSTGLMACTADGFEAVVGHWSSTDHPEADAWRIDIATVEQAVRDACKRYAVQEIVADPYRWSRSLQALAAEGLPIVEFPQTPARMIPATATFFDAAMDGRISYDIDDPRLTAHVRNCVVKVTAMGTMVSKDTKTSVRKIDLAVAAIMAHARAARTQPKRARATMSWI